MIGHWPGKQAIGRSGPVCLYAGSGTAFRPRNAGWQFSVPAVRPGWNGTQRSVRPRPAFRNRFDQFGTGLLITPHPDDTSGPPGFTPGPFR